MRIPQPWDCNWSVISKVGGITKMNQLWGNCASTSNLLYGFQSRDMIWVDPSGLISPMKALREIWLFSKLPTKNCSNEDDHFSATHLVRFRGTKDVKLVMYLCHMSGYSKRLNLTFHQLLKKKNERMHMQPLLTHFQAISEIYIFFSFIFLPIPLLVFYTFHPPC